MAEDTAFDVAEVQALRQEITTRVTLSSTLVALELATVGTGVTLLDRSTHVLAGLAMLSSFLWLLWIDHSLQVLKIAAYLAVDLGSRMSEHTGRAVLGWEGFLRRLNSGGQESAQALYRGSPPSGTKIVRALPVDWYSPLLFGVAPPLLLTLYVVANVRSQPTALVWLSCGVGVLLWSYTISRFIDFAHNKGVIDRAIVTAGVLGTAAEDPSTADTTS
jgi:hypothetical protein